MFSQLYWVQRDEVSFPQNLSYEKPGSDCRKTLVRPQAQVGNCREYARAGRKMSKREQKLLCTSRGNKEKCLRSSRGPEMGEGMRTRDIMAGSLGPRWGWGWGKGRFKNRLHGGRVKAYPYVKERHPSEKAPHCVFPIRRPSGKGRTMETAKRQRLGGGRGWGQRIFRAAKPLFTILQWWTHAIIHLSKLINVQHRE